MGSINIYDQENKVVGILKYVFSRDPDMAQIFFEDRSRGVSDVYRVNRKDFSDLVFSEIDRLKEKQDRDENHKLLKGPYDDIVDVSKGIDSLSSFGGIYTNKGGKGEKPKTEKPDISPPAQKPPLGLIPKYIHNTHRSLEIIGAIKRFVELGKEIPKDWTDELFEVLKLAKINKK